MNPGELRDLIDQLAREMQREPDPIERRATAKRIEILEMRVVNLEREQMMIQHFGDGNGND